MQLLIQTIVDGLLVGGFDAAAQMRASDLQFGEGGGPRRAASGAGELATESFRTLLRSVVSSDRLRAAAWDDISLPESLTGFVPAGFGVGPRPLRSGRRL
ncbi:MAG: hypothetical protein ACREFJ_04155 [Acetobacteraceae bacterium]